MDALTKCLAKQVNFPYAGMIATLAMLVIAGLVYWLLPKVRDRRGGTLAVETVDPDGTLRAELEVMRERAAIRAHLTFRVDPTRMTSGASVYGRTGRYTVRLHVGLLARRSADPDGFRAVVLHELAHVHHRDVDLAYASTALWRVFVAVALVPTFANVGWIAFLALSGTRSPWWPAGVPVLAAELMFGLLLAVLVHLARAGLLRHREFEADLQAVAWGASPGSWNQPDPVGPVAPVVHRLTPLLRTHPDWAERRGVLADTGRLFRARPLEMFLAGVSASLLYPAFMELMPATTAVGLTVALVTPVVCLTLGLPIIRSRHPANRSTGSDAVPGLGLGCGLLVGEFVASGLGRTEWLLPQTQYLAAFLIIGAIPAIWWSQVLPLALQLPKRGWRWGAATLCALVTAMVLWSGMMWWLWGGRIIAMGAGDQDGTILAKQYATLVPGDWQNYRMDLSALSHMLMLLTALFQNPVAKAATLLIWLVPLSLTIVYRAGVSLRLRRTLAAGLAGALIAWAGLATAMYQLYKQRPATLKERTGPYMLVHVWWMIATVLAACFLTAALVAAFSRRHWLLKALIAAQVAQLLAYGAVFLLYTADGCLAPFNGIIDVCHWRPVNGVAFGRRVVDFTLVNAVLSSACGALIGAGGAWVAQRLRRTPMGQGRVLPRQAEPRARRWRLPEVAAVFGLAVPTVLLIAMPGPRLAASGAAPGSLRSIQDLARDAGSGSTAAPPTPGASPTRREDPKVRGWKIWSWWSGGVGYLAKINAAANDLDAERNKLLTLPRNPDGTVKVDEKGYKRACGAMLARVKDAQGYFTVPDPALQKPWADALNGIHSGALACQEATTAPSSETDTQNSERGRRFVAALDELAKGVKDANAAFRSIEAAANYTG
ncbi:M48 family metalloprotease [Streptomyces sp. TP-A0356]|uniref:M48 family metalloprotease n=1 Tax=Streptomyces sp. TP-A0356 TaxID=1359208 RepID=UPI001F39B8B1|nr:M48 family metalloprotease [Streptomyces sp. TP-A0356]